MPNTLLRLALSEVLGFFIRVLFNFTTMRCDGDEVGLFSVVLSNLKEPDSNRLVRERGCIDHRGVSRYTHLNSRAESCPARLAGVNNIRPAGIAQIRWRVRRFGAKPRKNFVD